MAKAFNRANATIAAATATNLAAILVAEGYTGRMTGSFLEIDPGVLPDLYMGDSSSVDATIGRLLAAPFARNGSSAGVVDPSRIWLYSTAGGEFGLTFESL